MNVDILGISELKWTGMGEFNSDEHYIYYCGQESLRRNGVAIMVNKRVQNAVLGCNLRNDRMISVRFQGKPFNITVVQAYAPTSNAEEAEVEPFYEDLLELTPPPKKSLIFLIIRKASNYNSVFFEFHHTHIPLSPTCYKQNLLSHLQLPASMLFYCLMATQNCLL